MNNDMTTGVIISTYNNPQWLEKTLWGYMCQTVKADEIIIADDGSTDDTRSLIERYSAVLPLRHVWHEDKGFRKTKILNRALAEATADYLIFTDQDLVPRADFIARHTGRACRGRFLSGGCIRLPMDISLMITRHDIETGDAFRISWLKERGMKTGLKTLKLVANDRFAALMNAITPAKATWNGGNSSGWRADLLAVNGFNERMRYGGEDREFGERLVNMGLRGVQLRYSAVTLHLDHKRPYVNKEHLAMNKKIRQEIRRTKTIVTPYGIKQAQKDTQE